MVGRTGDGLAEGLSSLRPSLQLLARSMGTGKRHSLCSPKLPRLLYPPPVHFPKSPGPLQWKNKRERGEKEEERVEEKGRGKERNEGGKKEQERKRDREEERK